MTPEEKALLERTYDMVEENNKILRKMRRSNRFSMIFRITYWLIIIGLGFGAYYYLQPYLMTAVNVINEGQNVIKDIGGTFKSTTTPNN